MNSFKFYIEELKEVLTSNYSDYTLEAKLYASSEYPHKDFLVPEDVKEVKKRRSKKNLKSNVITIRRNSSAYGYYLSEYRENRMIEDCFGNVLVPSNDFATINKTR